MEIPPQVKDIIFNHACSRALLALAKVDKASRARIHARQKPKLMHMQALRRQIEDLPRRTPAQQKMAVAAMCDVAACLLHGDLEIDKLGDEQLAYLSSTVAIRAIAKARDAGVPVDGKAFHRIPREYIPALTETGCVNFNDATEKLHRALMMSVEISQDRGGSHEVWNDIAISGMFLGDLQPVAMVLQGVLESSLDASRRQAALKKLMASLGAMEPACIAQILDRVQDVLSASRLTDLLSFAVFTEIPEAHRASALHSVSFIACYRHEERASILKMLMWSIDCYLPAEQRGMPLSNLIAGLGRLPEHERESAHFALLKRVQRLPESKRSEAMCELAYQLRYLAPAERVRQFRRHLFVIESLASPAHIQPLIALAQQTCRFGTEHFKKRCRAILALCADKTGAAKGRVIVAFADDIKFLPSQRLKDVLYGMLCDEICKLPTDVRSTVLPNLLKQSAHFTKHAHEANVPAVWRMIGQLPAGAHGHLLSTLATALPSMEQDIATSLSGKIADASQALQYYDRCLILSALLNSLIRLAPNRKLATAIMTIFKGLPDNHRRGFVRSHAHAIERLQSNQPGTMDRSMRALLVALQLHAHHDGTSDFSGSGFTGNFRFVEPSQGSLDEVRETLMRGVDPASRASRIGRRDDEALQ